MLGEVALARVRSAPSSPSASQLSPRPARARDLAGPTGCEREGGAPEGGRWGADLAQADTHAPPPDAPFGTRKSRAGRRPPGCDRPDWRGPLSKQFPGLVTESSCPLTAWTEETA